MTRYEQQMEISVGDKVKIIANRKQLRSIWVDSDYYAHTIGIVEDVKKEKMSYDHKVREKYYTVHITNTRESMTYHEYPRSFLELVEKQ